jgi:polysaccharide deacetylase family protein (PEP-CTERM system associated)
MDAGGRIYPKASRAEGVPRAHPDQAAAGLPMKNALSFDVEDYFHVTGFEHVVDRARWDDYPVRFQIGMGKILAILERQDVKATFFFLGWIADRFPEVVADVAARGHEVAIHSYAHRLVYQQRPDEFEEDLARALAAVRRAYDGPILGYRAPTFSIRSDTLWALEIIKRLGFRYDSSIFPIKRDRYGIPNAEDRPHEIADGLLEFPMSTVDFLGRKLPVAGGGYLRLYPFAFTCRAIDQLNRRRGQPAIIYLHPWELDPGQPKIRADYANTFRHRVNLHRTEQRLEELCRRFQLVPVREVLGL